jgi:peptidoglycan/xylan/chitin deacetylase (PgdA/CDA1 family)
MYHRVASVPRGNSLPDYLVPLERFRRQMQGLMSRGYTPWPLRKALACHTAGRPIPPKTFVVTFDDGYECLYRDAWPVLREMRIPATVFLVTSFLDSDRPLRAANGAERNPVRTSCPLQRSLSTPQCNEMHSSGLIELGSHTHTHADFRGRPGVFRTDLEASLDALRGRFDLAAATFAFPFGHCSQELTKQARDAGVLCALTTCDQLVAPCSSPFDWGRFSAEPYDTAATLAAKLDGWYSALQSVWHRGQGRAVNSRVGP